MIQWETYKDVVETDNRFTVTNQISAGRDTLHQNQYTSSQHEAQYGGYVTVGLAGSASATVKSTENDALAAKGMFNVGLHIAKHGYLGPDTCTSENVHARREW